MVERIYVYFVIIIIKSEVWIITYCVGLGRATMVCAVCIYIFLNGTVCSYKYDSYDFKRDWSEEVL